MNSVEIKEILLKLIEQRGKLNDMLIYKIQNLSLTNKEYSLEKDVRLAQETINNFDSNYKFLFEFLVKENE